MRGLTAARLPLGVLTDSYKACHYELYPPGTAELEAVRLWVFFWLLGGRIFSAPCCG